MGVVRNLLLLALGITFICQLGGVATPFSTVACNLGLYNITTNSICSTQQQTQNLYNQIVVFMATAGVLTVVVTSMFPNPYTLFMGIASFLMTFFATPLAVINAMGIDEGTTVFLGLFFGIVYAIGLLNYIRGSGEI